MLQELLSQKQERWVLPLVLFLYWYCYLYYVSISQVLIKEYINQALNWQHLFDIDIFDHKQPFDDFNEYLQVIEEDYTIDETLEYSVYKELNHQMQNLFDIQFYDFDPVMKLSDYNKID